jgi:methylmalonyl-CoA/ethylmalonyl-CoA epimerase
MLKRIDHVGVVVDDLSQAGRFLSEVLGLRLVKQVEIPEQSLKAEFYDLNGVSIEVIEVSDPERREARLGRGAAARIEHIAIEVDDLGRTMDGLRDAGVTTQAEEARVVGGNRSHWTNPESCDGVMYQLFERVEGA